MFTGIVDHKATIVSIEKLGASLRLELQTEFTDLIEGESIAVDGACLTVLLPESGKFYCDLSAETMALTISPTYQTSGKVNVERALRMSDRMGGHWVTGHVDQTGFLKRKDEFKDDSQVTFARLLFGGILPTGMRYITAKGSITVNGVSLTVNGTTPDGFEVMLIPHTLQRTNLAGLAVDSRVNLEFDWMSKVIVNRIEALYPNLETKQNRND